MVKDENNSRSFDLSPHFFKNLADDVGLNMSSKRLGVRQIHELDHSDPRDPFKILELYISHLPQNYQETFYLYPFTPLQIKTSPVIGNDGQTAWYNPKLHYGKNQLGAITATQCTRVGMPVPPGGLGRWGPHGLRRKALEGCSEAGLGDTACMQFGGHTSTEGLKSYQDGSRSMRKIMTAAAFNGSTTLGRKPMDEALQPAMISCKQQLQNCQLPLPVPSPAPSTTPNTCRLQPHVSPVGWMPSPSFGLPFTPLPPQTPLLVAPTASVIGIKAILKELKECFDEGYMTADEYSAAKAKALA
jgi:hypothetical protein